MAIDPRELGGPGPGRMSVTDWIASHKWVVIGGLVVAAVVAGLIYKHYQNANAAATAAADTTTEEDDYNLGTLTGELDQLQAQSDQAASTANLAITRANNAGKEATQGRRELTRDLYSPAASVAWKRKGERTVTFVPDLSPTAQNGAGWYVSNLGGVQGVGGAHSAGNVAKDIGRYGMVVAAQPIQGGGYSIITSKGHHFTFKDPRTFASTGSGTVQSKQ